MRYSVVTEVMMSADKARDIDPLFREGTQIDEAIGKAAMEAINAHKREGLPVPIWQDGRTGLVPAEELETLAASRNRNAHDVGEETPPTDLDCANRHSGIPRHRLKALLADLLQLNAILQADALKSFTAFSDSALRYSKRQGSVHAASFHAKNAISTLLGYIDGLSFAMRRAVVDLGEQAGLALSPKVYADLAEKQYDPMTQSVTSHDAFVGPERSLRLACQYFPALCGVESRLDTGGKDWRGFKRLVKVRNAFTHPRLFYDLSPLNGTDAIQPTLNWFLVVIYTLFQECGTRAGFSLPTPAFPVRERYRERIHPWREVFSEDDYRTIKEHPSRSLEYVKRMLARAADDCNRAMALVSESSPVLGERHSWAFRCAVRARFVEVEVKTSVAEFFSRAAVERRTGVPVSEEKRSAPRVGDIDQKFVEALNAWTEKFGYNQKLQAMGPAWEGFRRLRLYRDRLAHPRSSGDLAVRVEHLQDLIDFLRFTALSLEALKIAPERWAASETWVADAITSGTAEVKKLQATGAGEGDGDEAEANDC